MPQPEQITQKIEDRLLKEQGTEAQIAELITPVLSNIGYQLVRVKLSNLNNLTLQIMAERTDGSFTIADCEKLHLLLSPIIEVENIITGDYNLEISSPGIDRPLVRKSDFQKHIGDAVKLETIQLINGKSKFKGCIEAVEPEYLSLRQEGEDELMQLEYSNLKTASLILTDKLIKETLANDKKLKKQNKQKIH
ncbi:ribosome maturation factor RimP [Bartonella sp. TP]|uniref:ribosome maturation factor RimP n=1 Tax=Bartonella sp. TP TaxID=3057550 RepID=UPI0025AFFAFA|nr:ribosome maturation factor RimP [Bartonella sp. TP]WJW80396.1 ribosome maturation factor RimP [Bartonella sp. TP]